jgi:hypothetical protein
MAARPLQNLRRVSTPHPSRFREKIIGSGRGVKPGGLRVEEAAIHGRSAAPAHGTVFVAAGAVTGEAALLAVRRLNGCKAITAFGTGARACG